MAGARTLILATDALHSHGLQRGVLRVFQHTVAALAAEYGPGVVVCSARIWPGLAARRRWAPRLEGWLGARASLVLGLRERYAALVAAVERPAVLYSPYYGALPSRAPQVYTVYDMAFERLPEHYPPTKYRVRRQIADKRRCLERGALLLAISETTAREIRAVYPALDPAKIVVVPLGVEEVFFSAAAPMAAGRPYFLFAGNRHLYKNFAALVRAFARSGLAERYDLRVFSPGAPELTAEERALVAGHGLEGRVLLSAAPSDEQVRDLYAGAAALVCPSLYEGFGLPVLEAMACGTVVAASGCSSLPEVGGDVALYFDPRDPDSIAAALVRVARLSPDERRALAARGRERARQFTWERFRARTVAAFRPLVERAARRGGG